MIRFDLTISRKEAGMVLMSELARFDSAIDEQLLSLPTLKKVELAGIWKQLFDMNAPSGMRKDLMLRILAYRLQERELGGLAANSRERLRHMAHAIEINRTSSIQFSAKIKPGTRLVRQWKSEVHVVTVDEQAYEYRGVRYKSLSQIARLVTGTRWSGPLFFGITPNQSNGSRPSR
jgi:Protein of unknown function (DUF2924)